jgi:hypothetical protein
VRFQACVDGNWQLPHAPGKTGHPGLNLEQRRCAGPQTEAPENIKSPAALSLAPVALAAASATAHVTPRLVSREVHEFNFHLRQCVMKSQHRALNLGKSPL